MKEKYHLSANALIVEVFSPYKQALSRLGEEKVVKNIQGTRGSEEEIVSRFSEEEIVKNSQ